jgi:uncharacterized protein YndB with AHSA1/START domain
MTINERAPVVAAGEIEIAANPEIVWDLLTKIDLWPSWNPDVKAVSMNGAVTEGTEFRWKSGPGTITSTIRRVEPPRLMAWTGKISGIKANHIWRLEPRDGKTIVRTEESWEGLVTRIFRARMQRTLQNAIDSGLRHLKAEAERRPIH